MVIRITGGLTMSGDLSVLAAPVIGDRGIFSGGIRIPLVHFNIIEYITISSLGDSADFGDLTENRRSIGALSDSAA